jgi:hypothetical protein
VTYARITRDVPGRIAGRLRFAASRADKRASDGTIMLNGWQRLWVVLVGISGLLVGLFMWTVLPTSLSDSSSFSEAERSRGTVYLVEIEGNPNTTEQIDWWGYGSLTEDEIEKVLANKSESGRRLPIGAKVLRSAVGNHLIMPSTTSDADAKAVVARYDAQVKQELSIRRRNGILTGIAIWLGFAAALYSSGWLVGWVRRGFSR